jgi:hypothetical protein
MFITLSFAGRDIDRNNLREQILTGSSRSPSQAEM